MSSKADLKLNWCSYEAAKYAVEHWHYSRCVPNQKTVKIGVWERGSFIGAVLFGDGANAGMFQPYGLTYVQGCELVRIALSPHVAPVSRIVSVALRMLKQNFEKLRLVLSFADPEQGHKGSIYQAGGWLYLGQSAPADEYVVNGARMHGRALRSTRSTHRLKNVPAPNVYEWARKVLDPGIQRVAGSAKHRYAMPLDAEIRARILPLAKPYPKRATSETIDTSGDQSEEGGAAPTVALQIEKVDQARAA